MKTIRVTRNFTLEELLASDTAERNHIDNTPGIQEICNLTLLVSNVLQPLRTWWGHPIKIGSGFRCKELNIAVGGVVNSQHMQGKAADLCIDGDLSKGLKWFNYIKDHLDFDQLIWEHNSKGSYWVHVSFDSMGNRHKVIDNLLKK